MNRRSVVFAAISLAFLAGGQTRADLIVGPSSFGTVGGSDTYWGIQFTALCASTLTGVDYNHRNPVPFGNPDSGTISLKDVTSNSTVYTYNYAANAPQVIALAARCLAGERAQLPIDRDFDGRFRWK